MSIPTDAELAKLRNKFESLMCFVASGQVSPETVTEALEAMMPEEKRIVEVPWAVDCKVAPRIKDAEVVLHHVYSDLRVTHGDLLIEQDLLGRFLRGRSGDTIPMRIGDRLLPAANLALYLSERKHLIPENWWGKKVVTPGTVYEGGEGRFVFGLECERTLQHHTCSAGMQRNSPDEARLVRIPFRNLRDPSQWCAMMPGR